MKYFKNMVLVALLSVFMVNMIPVTSFAVGGKTKYKYAYDSASQTNVNLKAVNNNNVPRAYTISGYWDEETGVTTEKSVN